VRHHPRIERLSEEWTSILRSRARWADDPQLRESIRERALVDLESIGVPERVAMQMTGHKTRSVFERYSIVSECDLVEAAKKLNALQPVPPA
jgi:hypothetical protein